MYLIFDPEMKNFPEVREEIEELCYLILINPVNGKVKTFTSMCVSTNEVSYTFYSEDLNRLNETVKQVEDSYE